jgi:hypothetical protein
MSQATRTEDARLADVIFTVILCVCAGFNAVVLVLFALLWAAREGDADNWAIALGVIGPTIVTVFGVSAAVVRVFRRGVGWTVALATIALNYVVWSLASLLAES